MGQEDIAMKMFMNHNDIFADIINNSVFKGRKVVKPEDLYLTNTETEYKGNHQYHNQYQDLSRFWIVHGVILARFSLENQMFVRRLEPVKLIGYDGAAYGVQITNDNGKTNGIIRNVYPCITIVLYFGKGHWYAPKKLHELIKGEWSEYLKQFTPDYWMNLVEVSFLSTEEIRMYVSDFRIIADYMAQINRNDRYEPSDLTMKYPEELFPVMNQLTGRDWRSEAIERMIKEGKKVSMVSAYAEIEKKAEERGINIGKTQMKSAYADIEKKAEERGMNRGINIGRTQMKSAYAEIEKKAEERGINIGRTEGEMKGKILAYHDMNLSVSDIARKLNQSEEEVSRVIRSSMN